jgi:DNA-binding protein
VILASRKAHIKDLVTQLEDSLASGEHASVKVLGCEDTITKAITVVEIVKRKGIAGLTQETQIYRKDFRYQQGEDGEVVVKKKSCIEITIRRAASDAGRHTDMLE